MKNIHIQSKSGVLTSLVLKDSKFEVKTLMTSQKNNHLIGVFAKDKKDRSLIWSGENQWCFAKELVDELSDKLHSGASYVSIGELEKEININRSKRVYH